MMPLPGVVRPRRGVIWLLHALGVLVAALYLFLVMTRGDAWFALNDPAGRVFDEGVELNAAARVLAGEVPYRDFALIYAPGQAYTLAAVFRLFGQSMAVERAYDLVVRLLLCISVYLLARTVVSSKAALAPFALATILLASAYYYAYTMYPALLFGLLSATVCLGFVRAPSPRRLFAAGLLAGIATIYRHDVGLYVLVSEVALLVLWAWAVRPTPSPAESVPRPHVERFVRSAWPLLAGLGTTLAPIALYLLAVVPLADLWYAFVAFPLTDFRSAFALPYPEPAAPFTALASSTASRGDALAEFAFGYPDVVWALFWTQPLIDAAGLLWVGVALYRRRQRPAELTSVWGIALVTLLAIAFFNQALNRADTLHLLPSGILSCLVLTGLASRALAAPQLRAPAAVALLLAGLVMAPAYVWWPLVTAHDALQWGEMAPCGMGADLARADCVFIFPDQADAIRFVQQRTAPHEAIFVGNAVHDRIVPNDALFYFVADRPNATRFDDLVSGLVSTARTQSGIIADLQRNQVRWVVLSAMNQDQVEPNAMGRPTGVTLLDDYIGRNYAQVQQFGSYTIWQRR
ncbi:MAG: hypothetical protein QOF51_3923 [Chloroflexota bacterium]|jgi:hypothetical protein|nr:hypothetical protein [Chloroflexota bacterium]